MSNGSAIATIIGVATLAAIVLSFFWNKEDVKRLQELKNKRRFGGTRLSAGDQSELERLQRRYWWY